MKRDIKIMVDPINTETIQVEVYEYGGYSFGFDWRINRVGRKEIYATELSTGTIVDSRQYGVSSAPKKALIDKLNRLVDNGDIQRGIDNFKTRLERRRKELQFELDSIPTFPINN